MPKKSCSQWVLKDNSQTSYWRNSYSMYIQWCKGGKVFSPAVLVVHAEGYLPQFTAGNNILLPSNTTTLYGKNNAKLVLFCCCFLRSMSAEYKMLPILFQNTMLNSLDKMKKRNFQFLFSSFKLNNDFMFTYKQVRSSLFNLGFLIN